MLMALVIRKYSLYSKHVGRVALAGNQDWAYPTPTPSTHTALLAGARSYLLHLFGNYIARDIATLMSFHLVILLLEIYL